jgi:hypothetical protein
MRLLRLSKKNRRTTSLGDNSEFDIRWASGPGFRDGPEDYFSIIVEADEYDFALEFNIDESREIKDKLNKFLLFIDSGEQKWYPGNYFKKLKK